MAFWGTKVIDPVCGMELDKGKAAASFEYQGKTYYFCALACKQEFEQNPEKYVSEEHEGPHKRSHGCH